MGTATRRMILLSTLVGLWVPMPVVQAAEAPVSTAAPDPSELFRHGMVLFKEGDHLGAAQAFEQAYRLKPHFSVLCNIALCHERRSDFVLAVRYYEDCLGRGGKDSPKSAEIKASLDQARARVSRLQVSSPGSGGQVFVDGRDVGPTPQGVLVNPGTHVVEVRRPGATPATRTVTARVGDQIPLVLVPGDVAAKPASSRTGPSVHQPRGLSPWWFWGATGITVALAVAATVFGVRTLVLQSDYEQDPTQERLDAGQTSRLVTNILWGLTAASGAASATLYFFSDFSGESATTSSHHRGIRAGVGIRGRF